MLTITHRPFRDDERKSLIENSGPKDRKGRLNQFSYYGVMVFFFSIWLARAIDWLVSMTSLVSEMTSFFASFIVSICICTYIAVKSYRAGLRRYERTKQDLEGGIIEILQMNVERAWAIDSYSTGDAFVLRDRDDRFVVINPEDRYLGYFPRRWLKIERYPRSQLTVEIILDGANVPFCMLDIREEYEKFLASFPPGTCDVVKGEDLPDELRSQVMGHLL